jgi:hypothetical protein
VPRKVTLQICDGDGRYLGDLPSFSVEDLWWPETAQIVAWVGNTYGADIWVLRLVHGSTTQWHPVKGALPTYGGSVTYVAQLRSAKRGMPLLRTTNPADDDALRAVWARPGGPDRILAWADGVLTALPPLLGFDPVARSVLLDDVPGADLYDCDDDVAAAMVERLVELQWRTRDRIDELLALGLPDWRPFALTHALDRLTRRPDVAATVDAPSYAAVRRLVDGLPERFARLGECGLPDTLVHGDAHPGNWHGDGDRLVLLGRAAQARIYE